MKFNEDAYRDKQLNKYLDEQSIGQDELERLEQERGRKVSALVDEFKDMLHDINKEYRDLDELTAKEVINEYS